MTKEYYNQHKREIIERVKEHQKEYRKTPMGRVLRLLGTYNDSDKKGNKGKGDLTAQWIVENILTKPCVHCGRTGWDVIGCNRIDNSKPHTKDNVEPCCNECNNKLNYTELRKKVGKFTLNDELVNVYDSLKDCVKQTNLTHSVISACCNNKYLREGNNIYKGYIWKYVSD